MCRLADGDRDAFSPLFGEALPVVRRYAVKLVGSEADADEVTQQTMLKVFSRAAEFDPRRDALRWVLGIATWEARTLRKSSMRRRETTEDEALGLSSGAASPEQALSEAQLRAALTEVISAL